MATYCNQHWLLSHIRNSFISTDDTGMCETVMASDDMPKHFLRKYQAAAAYSHHPRFGPGARSHLAQQRSLDPPLQDVDFICYPGLDQSDDEDMDLATQSFDIQMYPEVGAHRFRSNTAQKLEKMDIARRKAARTKCVNFEDEIVVPERSDFFERKKVLIESERLPKTTRDVEVEKTPKEEKTKKTEQSIQEQNWERKEHLETNKAERKSKELETFTSMDCEKKEKEKSNAEDSETEIEFSHVISKLTLQLANSPKQAQNKFMEYARFDGTSQTGIQTKRINVFLSMLPEKERNFPMKICVLASAKIIEVIGLVCYKATIQYPEIPLKSIRHYALYMTEDNDDLEDFPPLDNREPCSKFGFSHLTLAEKRPLAPVTRVDYNMATKSMTSEEDKSRIAAAALSSVENRDGSGEGEDDSNNGLTSTSGDDHFNNYEERMLNHNDMLEAPTLRTYRVNLIDKRFFKAEITLSISGERLDIEQQKHAKFWAKHKAVTYAMETVAHCEILERRNLKALLRIWIKTASGTSGTGYSDTKSALTLGGSSSTGSHSPTSPASQTQTSSPFSFFTSSSSTANQLHPRFKHYDFEADQHTAEQIYNKLNCILEIRSGEIRREFIHLRERKLDKSQVKKSLKL